jgi:hypothetical protein
MALSRAIPAYSLSLVVWKPSLTDHGKWGGSQGLTELQQDLQHDLDALDKSELQAVMQAALQAATHTSADGASSVDQQAVLDAVAQHQGMQTTHRVKRDQSVRQAAMLQRSTKTAMLKYMALTCPRMAAHMLALKAPGADVKSKRYRSLRKQQLPMSTAPSGMDETPLS